ncbi:putative ankyrin repeat protein [Pseudocercospora fuligena]|uniref:Putative ankyrin repeat protein n=1 Tax=Pseudocercospora fuligena TaxID=685502 RepID=A0A8H6R6Z1_9PEZI|nr:putative ankyrin repeat protein [Pseudocercospora fuligena]
MLQKIPPARKDGAIRLLQFLMLSPRPLWLGEAANALAMNIEGETLYDRDKELPDHSELALYCPGLISTVHVEGEEHKKLQLSHLSVKEYLLSALVHEEFRADLSTAKASSMVTVLLLRSFTQWFQSLRENLSEQEKHRRRHWPADNFPLALYAVHNWTEFARKAEVQAETQEYIVGFLIDQSRLECLLQCYNALNYDSYYVGPMYIAVEGRLLHTATALLRKGISSRMKHSYRGKTRHDMKRSYRGWKRYDETMSPLAVACQNGHHEMVKRLLKKQSRSSVDDFWGAATAAASEGHCHILELLFEKVPHWQSLEKPVTRSPVHAAIDGRHVDVLSMLLGHGFDANPRLRLKSKITRPAIQEAISIGDIAAIKLLVAHGADLKMGGCRNTVVHTAAQTSLSVMQHVSSYGLFLDAEDYDGTTPLHLACKGRNLAIAEFLIQHGADVTKRDGFGRTILHLAAEKGLLPLLEYTISIDMAVDLENHRGETPLHRAYSSGDLATVKFLVDHGADVTKRDNAGNTMLHSAANTGFLPLLEYTSSFGLPIDVGNEVGQRPLHCTSFYMYDNIEAVRFLVEAGADINKKNYRGHSPLAEAIDRQKRSRWANCRAGISYLRERGAIEPDLDRNGYSIPAPHPHAREIESLLNGWWKLHQRHPSTKHKRYKHRHGIPEYHSEDEDDIKRARKNFQPLYFQNPERPYEIHRYNPRRLKHFASSHF